MPRPVARRLIAALVLCGVGAIGCPPPQQRWLAGGSVNPSTLTAGDEDVQASRGRIEELRRQREAAGLGHDYRIGPGDLLKVSVFDLTEMERSARVSGAGSIVLPLIGTLKADGLSERELESEIAKQLGERYLRNPQVTVLVLEYNSQRVAVIGAVQRPGQFGLSKDRNTILDMISEAGGLARDAGGRIYLLPGERTDQTKLAMLTASPQLGVSDAQAIAGQAGGGEPIVVDVRDLLNASTRSALMLPARAGDVIVVPEGGQFLVDGWVEKPGAYPMSRGATVLAALTAAGGPLYPASTGGVQVVRTQRSGVRSTLSADVPGIIDGKAQDIPLEAGDIVYVPASMVKLPVYAIYSFINNVFRIAGTVPVL